MKRYTLLIFMLQFMCNTCQQTPLTSYLQLLPYDLIHSQMNYILSNKLLWQDTQPTTRVEDAIQVSIAFHQICKIQITQPIIDRMRSDLIQAKKHIFADFYPKNESEMLWNMLFSHMKDEDSPIGSMARVSYKEQSFSDNPKMFQTLMPLKALLAYSQIDFEWLKEFIMSKKFGGTLRKHFFINALEHQDVYWLNYLWNNKYRKKTISGNIRNMPFLRMALGSTNNAKNPDIHAALKKAYDERMERMKAAKTLHPG